MNNNYITALNGLRFYLFLMILATHYKFIIAESPIGQAIYPILNQVGIFAVLFFFVLSGFCIALGYSEKFVSVTKTNFFEFIKKRMKKIYPLYILTGLIMLFLFYLPINFNWLYAFIFLYIPMLSPFTKWPDGGGNGAGWFIAALFFCYIMTPFLIKFFRKYNLLKYLIIIYLCTVTIALLPLLFPEYSMSFMYKFTPVRVIHYSVGLILGMMYISDSYKLQDNVIIKKHPVLSECFIIALILLMMFGFHHGDVSTQIIGIPVIMLAIIFLCNIKNGFLYKLFTNKTSQYLGNLSFECYMIHYPLCILLSDKIKPYCSSLGSIAFFYLFLLFLTIILSIIYKKISQSIFYNKYIKLY